MSERGVDGGNVVYLGNDANDLPCFRLAGCAVVPCDAHPSARREADLVLRSRGGRGAVRELSDILLERKVQRGEHG
jgi:N-acylneuraminate cytidylyltransferase